MYILISLFLVFLVLLFYDENKIHKNKAKFKLGKFRMRNLNKTTKKGKK